MLSKCIGIVSYFPNKEPLRTNRKLAFNNLLHILDTYFKLPIVIIAQNWRDEDFNLEYYSNAIKIYSYKVPLGVTGANVILREKLLLENYDYFIHLDDDINIICDKYTVDNYFNEIDSHPNMFGQLKKYQLCAISKYMLEIMNWDYIKDMESWRGEIWEDLAYINTWKTIYPNRFFKFTSGKVPKMDFGPSENDPNTTWWDESKNQSSIRKKTLKIIDDWIHYIGVRGY